MKIALAIGVLVLSGGAGAADQRTLDEEQAKLLDEARRAALTYTDSLPDFLCTEVIRRQEDPRGDNRWRPVDTLTVRLSYFGHREDYKLLAVNGRPTVLEYLYVGGALSTGEFGSRLVAIFIPESKAAFEWKGWTRLRGRRAAVLRYRIAKENSSFRIQFGTVPVGPNSILVAYRGEVSIDEETHRVLRLTAEAEIPVGFPIGGSTSVIDYGFAEVGGRRFLLPVRAESTTLKGRYKAENNVEFRDYRKFQSEATISFDSPGDSEKPKPAAEKK
jgi:hypothetical protein